MGVGLGSLAGDLNASIARKNRGHLMSIPVRNLDEVRRGVEEALHTFGSRQKVTGNPPPITAGERIEKIGSLSAKAILDACEATAKDIEQTGHAAVEIAAEINGEAAQIAAVLRTSGSKISERLQEFALLARKVSTTMRDTRADLMPPSRHGEEETPST
jgi:hypothetical protein